MTQHDPFAEWLHVCGICGEPLTPVLGTTTRPTQWLHDAVHADHAADPRLLPPEE